MYLISATSFMEVSLEAHESAESGSLTHGYEPNPHPPWSKVSKTVSIGSSDMQGWPSRTKNSAGCRLYPASLVNLAAD